MRKKRVPNQYIGEHAGPYKYAIETPAERTAAHGRVLEAYEMETMLMKCGYASAAALAKRLNREGMGPEELRERLRVKYGAPGSLRYTHNARKYGDVT